ncbi:MAG: IS200/IS605 family element transposase accessory protein TnpB [Prochloron sp. SP5CPC1]|nr:IS200/IS605 family element transposase accessory protein TnpB [Candidatus Paraprochloron terpiosi SP5CPC1]
MVKRAYKYRFYPDAKQEQLLRRTLGCARLVYNKALAARTEGWYERQERIGYAQTSSMLTSWKKQEELAFLNEVSAVALQQALRHLQTALTNFWSKHAKYPNFKKKRNGGSAEFTRSAFKWKNKQLKLAKCKQPLNIVWSRHFPDECVPSTVTVRLEPSGRWFISILVDDPTVKPLPPVDKKVGLDVGLTTLVTTSDGDKIGNPRQLKKKYQRLRAASKALSRKQLKSNNRAKARTKVAKIHAKIADTRKDYLHKLTTNIIRENQTIVVENLAVLNMIKNRSLARSISDAGWNELVRQLEYKSDWYGRELIKIDRFYPSSKQCGNCGFVIGKLPLSVREWECPQCKTIHDRDINAAKNILAAGLAVSVCGASIRPDRQGSKGQLRNPPGIIDGGGKKQKPK